MGKFKDLTGEKFGRLYVQYIKGKTKDNKRYIYHCICDCGNECDKLGELLSNGKTKSCGCLKSETVSKNHKKYNQYDLSNDYGIGFTSKGEKFYFDIDDYEKIKNDYWYYCNNYVVCSRKGKIVTLSRFLMNCPDGYVVYHINHDTTDNRKINLRIATISQNGMNMLPPQNRECRGIEFNNNTNKWVARISVNKERITIGTFDNINDAIIARKNAEKKYYGEFQYNKNSQSIY